MSLCLIASVRGPRICNKHASQKLWPHRVIRIGGRKVSCCVQSLNSILWAVFARSNTKQAHKWAFHVEVAIRNWLRYVTVELWATDLSSNDPKQIEQVNSSSFILFYLPSFKNHAQFLLTFTLIWYILFKIFIFHVNQISYKCHMIVTSRINKGIIQKFSIIGDFFETTRLSFILKI